MSTSTHTQRSLAHPRWLSRACVLFLLLAALPAVERAYAISPADAFAATWVRSDAPVASGAVARTWMWGPAPLGEPLQEPYAEAPGGMRTVVYYDKNRMEVTHPDGDSTSPWYVTNGLLAKELITGEMQVGDAQWDMRLPAEINIAGDEGFPNGPTYAAFHRFLTAGQHNDLPARREGSLIRERVDAAGRVVVDERFAAYDVHALPDVAHPFFAVAAPFWEFMNSRGPVQIDGSLTEDTLFPTPVYATGVPITEPYWAEVVVGGTLQDVLLQCFERRCLTYTPSNSSGWQVEIGNIGQHYQQWRYSAPPQVDGQILFTRTERVDDGHYCTNLFLIDADGTDEQRLLPDFSCSVWDPQWSPDGSHVLFVNESDLFILRMATMDLLRLTDTPEYEWGGVWSPDGTQIVAMRDADGGERSLLLLAADGSGERVLSDDARSAQLWRSVAWSPDGAQITFLRSTGGSEAVDARQALIVMQVANGAERQVWEIAGGYLGHLEWTADGREVLASWHTTVDGDWSNADFFWYGGALIAVSVDTPAPAMRHVVGCLLATTGLACVDHAERMGTIWYTSHLARAPDDSGRIALSAVPMLDIAEPRTWRVLGSSGLFLLDPVNGDYQQLTHYGGYAPGWSPDGRYLLFEHYTHTQTGSQQLVAITSRDGTHQWVVARNADRPQWRPTPVMLPSSGCATFVSITRCQR